MPDIVFDAGHAMMNNIILTDKPTVDCLHSKTNERQHLLLIKNLQFCFESDDLRVRYQAFNKFIMQANTEMEVDVFRAQIAIAFVIDNPLLLRGELPIKLVGVRVLIPHEEMEVNFEGGKDVSFFNNQKPWITHVMKEELEQTLTRMLTYDLQVALFNEAASLKKKFAFLIVLVACASVFVCVVCVMVYKRFNKDGQLEMQVEGGEPDEQRSQHLSEDVIREYEVLELPSQRELNQPREGVSSELNTVREDSMESAPSTKNSGAQTLVQVVIRETP